MPAASNTLAVRTIAERIDEINKAGAIRSAEVIFDSINVEARTVEVAFSSETEVTRWYGVEILGHSAGEVDMSRMDNGASSLVDHNRSDVVGVIDSARIDADGKGRAVIRFGRSSRAEEIFRDVQDKIRTKVSVGYRVQGMKLVETREDGTDVYRITSWLPYEISWVSVPADDTVGLGRSEEPAQMAAPVPAPENHPVTTPPITGNHRQMPEDNITPAAVADAARAAAAAAHARTDEILTIGAEYGNPELASQFARDASKTVDEFMRALLKDQKDKGVVKPNTDVGMTERDLGKFSVVRAVAALLNPNDARAQKAAGFEFEISAAAAKNQRSETGRFVIPSDVLRTAVETSMDVRTLSAGSNGQTGAAASGSQTVATTLLSGSYIEALRNSASFLRNARVVGGLTGKFDIPKQTATATGYWLGEDDDTTETEIAFGQIHLSPKTVGAKSQVTRHLLNQSSLDVEALMRSDLAKAMALTIDKAGYYGTGTTHQPLGLYNQTGITVHQLAGAFPTYGELVDMETAIAVSNADVNSMRYAGNPKLRGYAKQTRKFPDAVDGGVIWEPGGSLNGYQCDITNQVNDGDVFFGNWADVLVGMWGGLEMMVDPYTGSDSGRVKIITFQDIDIALRRVESFYVATKHAP